MKSQRRFNLPENPVNFLKVILSDQTQSTGIRIPKMFAEKHGKDMLGRVILKVPNGDVWTVDLHKSKSHEIWLKDGWWEFAEHYGLKYGHLLMFNYEGFSIFGVIIFDKSASEIVYPPMKKDPLRNPTKEAPRNSQQEVKSTKLKTVKSEEETCLPSEDIRIGGECSRKSLESDRRAVERVKASFESNKPFFVVRIQPSYFTEKRGVRVSNEFRRKYWSGSKKHSNYMLKIANSGRQKTWEVLAKGEFLGSGDWLMFVKESGIKVGNICVFELIHKHQNVFHVTIRSTT